LFDFFMGNGNGRTIDCGEEMPPHETQVLSFSDVGINPQRVPDPRTLSTLDPSELGDQVTFLGAVNGDDLIYSVFYQSFDPEVHRPHLQCLGSPREREFCLYDDNSEHMLNDETAQPLDLVGLNACLKEGHARPRYVARH
jgi:hypothetical protein